MTSVRFSSVLIIDDDPTYCEVARTYLRQSGAASVLSAHHRVDALRILKDRPDLEFIILDLNMPDADGIEMLDALKRAGFTGAIAIVSGETPVVLNMAETLAQLHGLDVIDVVQKPLTPQHVDNWMAAPKA